MIKMKYIYDTTEIHNYKQELKKMIIDNDKDFPVSIIERVDLDNYLNKVMELGRIILAVEDLKVAGCILFYSNNSKTKIGYISLLCVDKSYRKMGIATQLINKCHTEMRRLGMEYCELSTDEKNNRSINLYLKHGFNVLKKNDGILQMRKSLININILLTSVGRRGYLVQYFKIALNDLGKVYASNSEYTSSFTFADGYTISPLIYDEKYIDFLINYCKENSIKMIVSLFDIDLYVLAKNKEKFKKEGITVVVSDEDFIKTCNDKWLTYQYLTQNGINTPKSFLSIEQVLLEVKDGHISFPLIVKPRWGMGSLGIYCAENVDELKIFYSKIKNDILQSYLKYESQQDLENCVIIQEKICGQEYGCDIINDLDGCYQSTIIRKKIAMRAGETDSAEIVNNTDILEITKKLANISNHIGNLDIDIIENSGTYHLLEMNARFGGGYPFSHIAGVDLPLAILKWYLNEPVDKNILEACVGTVGQKDFVITKIK